MIGELQPTTDPGKRFVALAEEHSADFATRASEHDREGSFPFENIEAMKQSGFIAAFVPEEFGGVGLTSLHDYAVGMTRLGRGDGSTAIAVNMHHAAVWTMQRTYRAEIASGEQTLAPVVEGLMRGVSGGQLVAAVFGTEAGTSLSHPAAEVVPDGDSFLFNGKKIFGTLSPVATIYFSPARLKRDDGTYEAVLAMMGKGTPGVEIKDNWDAMGMRASGSGDVNYTDVRLGAANVIRSGNTLGEVDAVAAEMNSAVNVGLIATFTGIAESAAAAAIELAKSRRKGPSNGLMAERHWMQSLVGEMMVDLDVCRGMLAHTSRDLDAHIEAHPKRDATIEDAQERQRLFQSAKYVVNRKAIEVVDKALTISGGAGYMAKHPLSRMYRDVRAGPFMQPFSPPEALQLIGRTALGQEPKVEM